MPFLELVEQKNQIILLESDITIEFIFNKDTCVL